MRLMKRDKYLLLLAALMTCLFNESLASQPHSAYYGDMQSPISSPRRIGQPQVSQQQHQALLRGDPFQLTSQSGMTMRPMSPVSQPTPMPMSPSRLTRALSPVPSQYHQAQPSIPTYSSPPQSFTTPTSSIPGVQPPTYERVPSFVPMTQPPQSDKYFIDTGYQSPIAPGPQFFSSGESGTPPFDGGSPLLLSSSNPMDNFRVRPEKEHKYEKEHVSSPKASQSPRTLPDGPLPCGILPYPPSRYIHLLLQFLHYIPNFRLALYRSCTYNKGETIPALLLALTRLQQANHDRLQQISASLDIGPLFEQYLASIYTTETARNANSMSVFDGWEWVWKAMDVATQALFTFKYDLNEILQTTSTSTIPQSLKSSRGNASGVLTMELNDDGERTSDLQQWITQLCTTGHSSKVVLQRGVSEGMDRLLNQSGSTREYVEGTTVNVNTRWTFTSLPTNLMIHLKRIRPAFQSPDSEINTRHEIVYRHELLVPLRRARLEDASPGGDCQSPISPLQLFSSPSSSSSSSSSSTALDTSPSDISMSREVENIRYTLQAVLYFKNSSKNFRVKIRTPAKNNTQWYMFNYEGTVEASSQATATSHSNQAVLLLYSTGDPAGNNFEIPDHYRMMLRLAMAAKSKSKGSPIPESAPGLTYPPQPLPLGQEYLNRLNSSGIILPQRAFSPNSQSLSRRVLLGRGGGAPSNPLPDPFRQFTGDDGRGVPFDFPMGRGSPPTTHQNPLTALFGNEVGLGGGGRGRGRPETGRIRGHSRGGQGGSALPDFSQLEQLRRESQEAQNNPYDRVSSPVRSRVDSDRGRFPTVSSPTGHRDSPGRPQIPISSGGGFVFPPPSSMIPMTSDSERPTHSLQPSSPRQDTRPPRPHDGGSGGGPSRHTRPTPLVPTFPQQSTPSPQSAPPLPRQPSSAGRQVHARPLSTTTSPFSAGPSRTPPLLTAALPGPSSTPTGSRPRGLSPVGMRGSRSFGFDPPQKAMFPFPPQPSIFTSNMSENYSYTQHSDSSSSYYPNSPPRRHSPPSRSRSSSDRRSHHNNSGSSYSSTSVSMTRSSISVPRTRSLSTMSQQSSGSSRESSSIKQVNSRSKK